MQPTKQLVVPIVPFRDTCTAGTSYPLAIPSGYDFFLETVLYLPTATGTGELTIAPPDGLTYFRGVSDTADSPDHGAAQWHPLVTLPGGIAYTIISGLVDAFVTLAGYYLSPPGDTII